MPGAPQNLVGSNSVSAISLQWAAPLAGCSAAPSNYLVEIGNAPGLSNLANASVGAVTAVTVPATAVPPGSYYFRVRAQNAAGTGPASNEVVLTYGGPGAPGNFTVVKAATSMTLTWTAPTTGGAVTGYTLELGIASGVTNASYSLSAVTTVTTPALPRGTYFMRIKAKNAAGTGAPSNEVRLVVP